MKLLSIIFAGLIVALVFLGTFFLILLFYIFFETKVANVSIQRSAPALIQAREIFFQERKSSEKHSVALMETTTANSLQIVSKIEL